jgi:RND family efflux transporter MFP subunit
MKNEKMRKIIISYVSLLLLVSCAKEVPTKTIAEKSERTILVKTITIRDKFHNEVFRYYGVVVPYSSTPLSFQVPGLIQKIQVSEGEMVKKGQLLAEINKTSYQSAYQMSQAILLQTEDAFSRLKKVYDKGSLPEIKWQEVQSQLTQAKSANEIAKQSLENCDIRASNDGFIGERNIDVGATATPNYPAFILLNIHKVYVRISVSENEIIKFKKGQKAMINIPAIGSRSFEGYIDKIGVMANNLTKTYEVKICVLNEDLIIRPGMACHVQIDMTTSIPHITIPYKSIIQNDNKEVFVFKVDSKSHKVKKRKIETGSFRNNEIIVLSGLKVGDIIVTTGHQKLSDNSIVKL